MTRIVAGLNDDIKLGQTYLSNANLQLATVLLVQGKSAHNRGKVTDARAAWEEALRHYPRDMEAERYLGELALAQGEIETALEHFERAYDLAPDDRLLKGETLEAVATYYREQASDLPQGFRTDHG